MTIFGKKTVDKPFPSQPFLLFFGSDAYLTVNAFVSAACNHKGAIYRSGQSFNPDTCNTCWCMVDGSISCTDLQCYPGKTRMTSSHC